jgi:putative transcriptional regulator
MIGFEWDPDKAARNIVDHKVSFEQAAIACQDPFAVEWITARSGSAYSVCTDARYYTSRTQNAKTTSGSSPLAGPNDMNRTDIIVRMHPDGTLHRVMPDGTEVPMPDPGPLAPMTEEEVSAAARRDPDAQPITEEEFRRARRVPRIKALRRALALTQEEFATRYHIPLGTLRDWEQGRSEPDQPARAYLTVIARDPEGVRRALEARPG